MSKQQQEEGVFVWQICWSLITSKSSASVFSLYEIEKKKKDGIDI